MTSEAWGRLGAPGFFLEHIPWFIVTGGLCIFHSLARLPLEMVFQDSVWIRTPPPYKVLLKALLLTGE